MMTTFAAGSVAAVLRCPPLLPGPHPGFEQVGPIPAAHWLLRRMRLFDTPPGNDPATEIDPRVTAEQRDSFTLNWHFEGNDSLTIICLYNGSGTYYRARLPTPPTNCTLLHFEEGLTQAWCELP